MSKKEKLVFEITVLNKKGAIIESRQFAEQKVMEFYVKWMLPKAAARVVISDITVPQRYWVIGAYVKTGTNSWALR